MNVLLEVDDRKHVLLKQVLVLHLLRHFSEKTNLNTIDDDALEYGDVDVLMQVLVLIMLARYAKKAALFATENKSVKLPHTEWALIPRG